MLYAKDNRGEWIEAEKGQEGYCPSCQDQLIPKCGEVKMWHWSHKGDADCDSWQEPESEWHRRWKELVMPGHTEVCLGEHRADIVGNYDTIIELQHSSLGIEQIREREEHYQNMIWIYDARDFVENLDLRSKGNYSSFRWKHPRMTQAAITKPLFWDFGYGMFRVKLIHSNIPCGGWGIPFTREQFIEKYLSRVIRVVRQQVRMF